MAPAVSRKSTTPVVRGRGHEAAVVVQHGGNDAGRAIGGGRDHAAASGVLFIDGQRKQIDPVHHVQRVGRCAVGLQLAIEPGCASGHAKAARQGAFLRAAARHAVLHHLPDVQQAGVCRLIAAPMLLIAPHDLSNADAMRARLCQQFGPAVEGQGQHGWVWRDRGLTPGVVGRRLAEHEAAAHRVVGAFGQQGTIGIPGLAAQAIGVKGQALAAQKAQCLALLKRHRVLAQQRQPPRVAHGRDPRFDLVHRHGVGFMPHPAQQHGLVAAVASAGGAEGTV